MIIKLYHYNEQQINPHIQVLSTSESGTSSKYIKLVDWGFDLKTDAVLKFEKCH